MASYLEVKQVLKEIVCMEADVDENCDIVFEAASHSEENLSLLFSNIALKDAFDRMQSYTKDRLEMLTTTSREVALQLFGPIFRNATELEPVSDTVNGITYSVGPASLEYCLFLLDAVAENVKSNGRRAYIDLRHRCKMAIRRNWSGQSNDTVLELLPEILRAYTIKVESVTPVSRTRLKEYAASFEFLIMYRKGLPVSEYADVEDMYSIGNSVIRYSREDIDSPPQRIYNSAVLDYYTMAMESRDPFTMYISFYHIIEHYFDAVFRKKLTEEIKNRITRPDFSYKNESNLYDLAKYIKKHMSSDDATGKGNEFESLKYVLMEYVPIDELKTRINQLDTSAIAYYQNNFVPFTTSKKTKISWSDSQGVYTNLATRIYETRNALVHSKSEQSANQYKPYENRKELSAEIALIKAVAEMTLINSSEIL